MMRLLSIALVSLLLAGAAPAPDRPALAPEKDMLLGYHLVPAQGEKIDVRVAIRAGGRALRIDLPDTSFMIANTVNKALTLVVPLERTMVDLPWSDGPQTLFLLDPKMQFTRKGEATIAGTKCVLWATAMEQARGTVCVTPDGTVLRSQMSLPNGRQNTIEAFVVRQASLAEADYAVPRGFETLLPQAVPGR